MMGRRFRRFIGEIINRTLFLQMVALLAILWMAFSAAIFLVERGVEGSAIRSFGDALYWGIAALSTAGIADSPVTGASKLIGGVWIIIGSVLFFGIIVSTVTAYFMRPVQRPPDQLIESIEYSLEELDQLSVEELDLLKETVDTLIEHVEHIKSQRQ
ncbi:MAG: two pore domain potassium channel family protein [Gammaproteobacteria bacterium]|jgi:voltage-gated potassium channel|nr:two pore domain potassium channel family protein [Gammaproteobacteria bacterium]